MRVRGATFLYNQQWNRKVRVRGALPHTPISKNKFLEMPFRKCRINEKILRHCVPQNDISKKYAADYKIITGRGLISFYKRLRLLIFTNYNNIGGKIMRNVKVGAVQMSMTDNVKENIEKADMLVRKAAGDGCNIILLPELFENLYFCQERNYDYYKLAKETEDNDAVKHFKQLAKELNVVLPISFYEKHINSIYNSVAVINADGEILGVYRKSHIPDDHFYQEKFYFTPGNTGFKVWDTKFGRIGVGICWDQWFPETARCMALMGAELLFYPTAIGSEPILEVDSMPHWRRCMQGHAAANIVPVIAANRAGTEKIIPNEENNFQSSSLTFYGSSFITDETGEIKESAGRDEECIITSEFDLDAAHEMRFSWGIFRDRRPELYTPITD